MKHLHAGVRVGLKDLDLVYGLDKNIALSAISEKRIDFSDTLLGAIYHHIYQLLQDRQYKLVYPDISSSLKH